MTFQQTIIGNYSSGVVTNKKPFLLNENAFSLMENAYCYRERIKKRNGLNFIGRLRRVLSNMTNGLNGAPMTYTITMGTNLINIFQIYGNNVLETNAEIQPGTATSPFIFKLDGNNNIFTDTVGNGILVITGTAPVFTFAYINYSTGIITAISIAATGAVNVNITMNYYPGLPVMGIWQKEQDAENNELTVCFDTRYAYIYSGDIYSTGGFIQLGSAVWTGTDSEFFSATNWRNVTNTLLFFVTNFSNPNDPVYDPPRYFTPSTWTDFTPRISNADATQKLWQARIFIPYYGRLLAFNTWEGPSALTAVNIPNRCRFAQIGDPLQSDAWYSDVFGKGGFIDAPTSEDIISVTFFKNTLIVGFERTTWSLRYVGDYGLPFIWERISSDFGTESQFSAIIFDQGVFSVGDKAIVSSDATTVQRIDLDIPNQVFEFRNDAQGTLRVHGIRDFQKELVFWTYRDSLYDPNPLNVFPNKILLYNYRNGTYANLRENVTAWGTFQNSTAVSWDSTDVFWDDESVTWNDPDGTALFPSIICGNQMGYVHVFEENTTLVNQKSLSIHAVDLTTVPIQLTVPNHNLVEEENVFLDNLMFLDTSVNPFVVLSTDLNGVIYQVIPIDKDTLKLLKWNGTNYQSDFTFTPVTTATYVGGGTLALLPKMNIQTKDFNPYAQTGMQFKISYLDLMTDATTNALVSVQMFINSFIGEQANLLVGNQESETYLQQPYYIPQSQYAWHRFYATLTGQYLRIGLTYDDTLMNITSTHEQDFELNSMILYTRTGGKNIF